MHMLVYISDFIGVEPIKEVLDYIIDVSAINNFEQDITGVLFYHNGQFLQLLEGDESKVRHLMSSIYQDNRHNNIKVIVDQPIASRSFAGWSLKAFNISNNKIIDASELIQFKEKYDGLCQMDAELFLGMVNDLIADEKLIKNK